MVGGPSEEQWRLTGFYGEPKWEHKHLSWGYLCGLHQQNQVPWVVMGDFNEILCSHEKERGVIRIRRIYNI